MAAVARTEMDWAWGSVGIATVGAASGAPAEPVGDELRDHLVLDGVRGAQPLVRQVAEARKELLIGRVPLP